MDAQTIAESLGGKRSGKGWIARCPAHDDKHPSLSITEVDDGKVLINCHAGCHAADVVAAIGLELKDLFPESSMSSLQRSEYRRKQTHSEIETAFCHELSVMSQVIGQRVADRMLAKDSTFRKQRPEWQPIPNAPWDRELLAAKRIRKALEMLYGE